MHYQPIENYGVIGDLHTIALVGMNGSIDFLCYPEFDSPSVFASILDQQKGGAFQILSRNHGVKTKQLYFPDTNVLISRFLSEEGVAEITDFMPIAEQSPFTAGALIRRAKGVRGLHSFTLHFKPRFDYARKTHKTVHQVHSLLFLPEGAEIGLRLTSSIPLHIREGDGYAEFVLKEGESVDFILSRSGDSIKKEHLEKVVTDLLFETIHFWRTWLGFCQYEGRWQEMVNRSALLLKLMTARKYGAIVASPTFGLPEEIGGSKNWDYRYMWIRDAAFSLYALIRLGFTKEAGEFINWLGHYCREINKPGGLGLMYPIRGEKKLEEIVLDHLEGYKQSQPVRIGNAAHGQLQLDIYGELVDSIYLYNKYGEPISYDLWMDLSKQVDWLCQAWDQPDEGIWEVREGAQKFLYSRLMIWVAFDRMIRMARQRSFPMPDRWRKGRDTVYYSIFKDFWNEERKTFVQFQGSDRVDASVLLMPLTRFIGARDPRWLSTLRCIETDLVADSLVYRYRAPNIKEGDPLFQEGTFSLCSFWYVESLSRAGFLDKARYIFEKMLGYANHLGLYGEQLSLQGEHLGNFPQAFTHLGLISAAYNLNQNLNDRRNKQF